MELRSGGFEFNTIATTVNQEVRYRAALASRLGQQESAQER